MKVSMRFPSARVLAERPSALAAESTVDQLLADLEQEPVDGRLGVGDERVREFLAAFSRRLLRGPLARRYPELASLGFFLRPGEIARALQRLNQAASGARRFPRGAALPTGQCGHHLRVLVGLVGPGR
jgi:hypothetical protein